MAAERDNGVTSENEEEEKPVREQLKKASIGGVTSMADETTTEVSERPGENGDQVEVGEADKAGEAGGRLQKKRSFEEFEGEQAQGTTSGPARHHSRKRSRDSTAEEDELNNGQRKSGERSRDAADAETHTASNGAPKAPTTDRPHTPEHTGDKRSEAAVGEMTSPKSKRSRLQPATEEIENGITQSDSISSETTAEEKTEAKAPSTSGFTSTSATSPFASLAGSKSPSAEPPQTSASAFAASGFGSLAASSSSKSGFGAIGKTSGGFGAGGGFATGGKSPLAGSTAEKENEKSKPTPSSAFGGVLGQKPTFSGAAPSSGGSAFGGTSSGFGKLGQGSAFGGTGFGSLGGGSSLSSFASGKPPPPLASSSKPTKVFGASTAEDEETEEGGDVEAEAESGMKSPLSQESDKQDERFYEQDLETGEEEEMTEYSCRSKLYNFVTSADGKKEWKERGLGVVRLNVRKPGPEEEDAKSRARLLMRAEGSHRVILNTPVKKELKFGAPDGGAPQGGYVYFMGTVDGKEGLELLQLKVRRLVYCN